MQPVDPRFAHARLGSRAARLLPLAPAPAWMLLHAPLNPESSTRLRAQAQAQSQVAGRPAETVVAAARS